MDLYKLLNKALELVCITSEDIVNAPILKYNPLGESLYVGNDKFDEFVFLKERIYNYNESIKSRFSREVIYKYIQDEVFKKKISTEEFKKEDSESFFKKFLQIKPKDCRVIAPISGIRLDSKDTVQNSIFEVGKIKNLKFSTGIENAEYYISVKVNRIYDDKIAIELARDKFSDFIRIIAFISGRNDKKINIKVGLPVYSSMSHEKMYVESTAYSVIEDNEFEFGSTSLSNIILEKIPLDNPFFQENENFKELWKIYDEPKKPKNGMRQRLLNASISIGESALSKNTKNSVIYTSMAFEILFSLNESSLFQKGIADKLADTLAFLTCTDKETRLEVIKEVKNFYALRSALVHGGNPSINDDYIMFNTLLSAGISQLLNNSKYEKIKVIEDLYKMLKEAQNSY